MQAIRLTQKLDSDTLYLPQLRPFVGKQVEIIVLTSEDASPETTAKQPPKSLIGSVLEYSDPFEPAVPADDWEACR